MFRSISRFSLYNIRSAPTTRAFHRITTNFNKHDTTGKLNTEKVDIVIGDPEEAYVLIGPEISLAFCAAASASVASTANVQDRCKLRFFHDSRHFGSDSSSYPRLYVPNQIPRQTDSNVSPATLMLYEEMHEIVLDGTFDAKFAEHGEASARRLKPVLDMLKYM